MKKTLILFIFCSFSYTITAQISGSIKLGLAGYQGDIHCRTDANIGIFDQLTPAFGIGVRLPINEQIGLRAEASAFRLSADEALFENVDHKNRGWTFNNNFIEVAAMVDWELWGHKRWTETRQFKRTLTPVIFAGLGVSFNNPEVDFQSSSNSRISNDKEDAGRAILALPVGLGLKYYMSERFAFALELGMRLPTSDYYDGISLSGNADQNDAYGFGGIKAYFSLNKIDTKDNVTSPGN